jgi:hypothetical protein
MILASVATSNENDGAEDLRVEELVVDLAFARINIEVSKSGMYSPLGLYD